MERHFQSSLVALVSLSSRRRLRLCHFKRKTEITNTSYSNSILAVRVNRKKLVVCLEDSLFIHDIRSMELVHTIKKTPPNPKGLCALSPSSELSLLAYPGQQSSGAVQIFDTTTLQNKITITAHDSALAAIVFDPKGEKLATASERGTVIRVFDVTKGHGLYEFRRGIARCVSIHSLSFSSDSLFLCASSDTETVHIFKLERPKDSESVSSQETSIPNLVSTFIEGMGNLLPLNTSVFNQLRSFAQAKLPCRNGLKNICAITPERGDRSPKVLVASYDGFLYIYDLDVRFGGECTLLRQHKLDSVNDIASDDVAYSSPGKCLNLCLLKLIHSTIMLVYVSFTCCPVPCSFSVVAHPLKFAH